MKNPLSIGIVLAVAAFAGCAASAASTHAPTPATEPPPAIGGAAARLVEFPPSAGAGQPREVRVLVDEPALKLVTLILRRGTVLPEHHSPVPVTIQALSGAGTLIAGSERFRIDAAHAVVLAAAVPHAVEPDPGTDLVLLVHHLGRAAEHHR